MILGSGRNEKNFGSKMCSRVWIKLLEGKHYLIENNISRNINSMFSHIKTFKSFVENAIAQGNTLLRM
jgi:hypothetical protein